MTIETEPEEREIALRLLWELWLDRQRERKEDRLREDGDGS